MSLFPLWKVIQPALGLFDIGSEGVSDGSAFIAWVAAFTVLFLLLVLVLVLSLWRLTKGQVRKPLMLGWAVSGSGRCIAIEKVRPGKRPFCGGDMRYYNKPTKWIDRTNANGRKHREVTERLPALEWTRNPRHWVEVDPAEKAQ